MRSYISWCARKKKDEKARVSNLCSLYRNCKHALIMKFCNFQKIVNILRSKLRMHVFLWNNSLFNASTVPIHTIPGSGFVVGNGVVGIGQVPIAMLMLSIAMSPVLPLPAIPSMTTYKIEKRNNF